MSDPERGDNVSFLSLLADAAVTELSPSNDVARKRERSASPPPTNGKRVCSVTERSVTERSVTVACGERNRPDTWLKGDFLVDAEKIMCHGRKDPVSPAEFERLAGRSSSKKWRESIWVLSPDGSPFCNIGKYLDMHAPQQASQLVQWCGASRQLTPWQAPPGAPCMPDERTPWMLQQALLQSTRYPCPGHCSRPVPGPGHGSVPGPTRPPMFDPYATTADDRFKPMYLSKSTLGVASGLTMPAPPPVFNSKSFTDDRFESTYLTKSASDVSSDQDATLTLTRILHEKTREAVNLQTRLASEEAKSSRLIEILSKIREIVEALDA